MKTFRKIVLCWILSCVVSVSFLQANESDSRENQQTGLVAAVNLGPGKTAVMAYTYLETEFHKIAGKAWSVAPFGSDRLLFQVTPKDKAVKIDRQDLLAYQKQLAEISNIEKVFILGEEPVEEAFSNAPSDFEGGRYKGLSTRDPQWSNYFMDVYEAWEKIKSETGREPGEGVLIGQVDTGLLEHPEIWPNGSPLETIRWEESRNFRERRKSLAVDQFTQTHLLSNLFPPVPSHGTATASVMISPKEEPGSLGVSGVAPGAELLPVRSGISAVYIDVLGGPVTDGVKYSIKKEANVIVLAMGGPPNPRLKNLVKRAVKNGAIVVAAGGNHVKKIPRPGVFPETITAAAGNIECKPWDGTTPGDAIDILAPGHDVWHATSYMNADKELIYAVRRGVGTSFAAPITAGVAALWLSYHGHDNLKSTYGPENVYKVFRWVLQNGGSRKCPGVAPGYGAGYLNALKLLETELPDRGLFE